MFLLESCDVTARNKDIFEILFYCSSPLDAKVAANCYVRYANCEAKTVPE